MSRTHQIQKKKQANGSLKVETAHYYMECSNKGLCDRAAATCVCFTGYEGHSCQRASCPNDCSGHGVCKTNRELADDNYNNIYELWDADMVSPFNSRDDSYCCRRAFLCASRVLIFRTCFFAIQFQRKSNM